MYFVSIKHNTPKLNREWIIKLVTNRSKWSTLEPSHFSFREGAHIDH
jgi:hypothetical protein